MLYAELSAGCFYNKLQIPKHVQESSTAERKNVERFKSKYSLKGIQELEKIAKNQKMVPVAITATLEVIEDKSQ